MKFLLAHFFDVQRIDVSHLRLVENTRRMAHSGQVKFVHKFCQSEFFYIIFSAPSEQCNVIDYSLFKKALFDKVLVARIAITLT